MRIADTTVYNSYTNQPLYAYAVSTAPDADLPKSLISLRNVPTGVTIGTIRRGGSSTGQNMVLRDAIAHGNGSDGDIKFADAAASVTEDMVGEAILILVYLRLNGDDEKQVWLWELLCW